MWVFASRLPDNFLKIAIRAPYPSMLNGFSWTQNRAGKNWPGVSAFQPAIEKLLAFMDAWESPPFADFERFRLMGFSQGAALAYAFAISSPERVEAVAGLSGFVPEGLTQDFGGEPLRGMPIFASHGTEDELVPIARARQGIEILQGFGADVTYCEDEVGHKLSANCFNGFEVFFE
jgi:phospholipase/carboxylesterase